METEFKEPRYFVCTLATQAAKNLVSYYNRALSPLGITAHQLMALGVLWKQPGISLGEFARSAGVGKAAAVAMVKRLAAQGLVTVAPHEEDARLNCITLTEKAWELAPEIYERFRIVEERLEDELGTETLNTLLEALNVIRDLDIT